METDGKEWDEGPDGKGDIYWQQEIEGQVQRRADVNRLLEMLGIDVKLGGNYRCCLSVTPNGKRRIQRE